MMFIFVIVTPMFVIQQITRINIQRKQKILTASQLNIASSRAGLRGETVTDTRLVSKALCSHLMLFACSAQIKLRGQTGVFYIIN